MVEWGKISLVRNPPQASYLAPNIVTVEEKEKYLVRLWLPYRLTRLFSALVT